MNCEELGISILSNNAEALAKFYEDVLGLFVDYNHNEQSIRLDGKRFTITVNQSAEKVIPSIQFTIYVDDFNEMKDRLTSKGCEPYYDSAHPNSMEVKDIDGNEILFYMTNHR